MKIQDLFNLKEILQNNFEVELNHQYSISVYPRSVITQEQLLFFIGRIHHKKYLFIASSEKQSTLLQEFSGIQEAGTDLYHFKKCPLNHVNAEAIQKIFPFTRPQLVGLQNSFGFGDRLGLANPGHLQALAGSGFKPVLAQQSIRELQRTQRTPEEVMSAAVWAAFQEGYQDGFGADADHLKTTADIDLMVEAGFTMFTIDPGDQVNNAADSMTEEELLPLVQELPWKELGDTLARLENRYVELDFYISENFSLHPSRLEMYRAVVKYGQALAHIRKMAEYLKTNYPEHPAELEISVDETEAVTTPFEHFFMANELKRMGIAFISLAPRFIGRFEKGVDYRGDVTLFREEYAKHLQIVNFFNSYKLSLHSGSDKFSVYKIIGSFKESCIHVKTAGTSYLEALRVLAAKVPDFFREILDFSRGLYEEEKRSYHVSADVRQLKSGKDYPDPQLLTLFLNDDARQVLHVTFGRVLTARKPDGSFLFRTKILEYLNQYEETYYQYLREHFKKHLEPFGR
jgi:hypothetical protein